MSSSLPPAIPLGEGASNPNFGVRRSYFKKKYWNDLILQKAQLDKQQETLEKLEQIRTEFEASYVATNNLLTTLVTRVTETNAILVQQFGGTADTPKCRTYFDTIAARLIANNVGGVAFTVGQSTVAIRDASYSSAATNTLYTQLVAANASLDDIEQTNSNIEGSVSALDVVPLPVIL